MTQYKVTAPETDYSGTVGKVQFRDGSAVIDDETNPAELAYCRSAGYSVEEQAQRSKSLNEALDHAYSGEPDDPDAFDPSAHDMPTVLAYLKDADETEAVRVLDAETAGKDRKGITGQRDAILASKKESEK